MKKKREKRFWNKSKWKRKDQFNKKRLTHYERWYESGWPVRQTWKDIRTRDRENISKIMNGYDPDENVMWIVHLQYYVDYY